MYNFIPKKDFLMLSLVSSSVYDSVKPVIEQNFFFRYNTNINI